MKKATSINPNRSTLVSTIIQAYMDLFITMQFNAVSHWLMLELTFAQARALFMLAARKELTVSQLARLLGVGNPTASILVQQLVERDLVTRTEQATDRRHTIIRLSQKGAEIGAGRRKQREKQWQHWLSHLSDEELEALAHGLSAIVEVVKKELEDEMQQIAPALSQSQ
ncbi:MAG TPA: MarR family transcriptional regulator [Anaerolineales bacterium]|nr:MarR family transcriptional regulator [Anaerolineales bacterium]